MSEGRTPDATLTELRKLEPEDVDILHQIVIRAQNDSVSSANQKDALLKAYGEIFEERQLDGHQDRACFNFLLKLLSPAFEGPSLYHKFEAILEQEGIQLAYDDDATTSQPTQRSGDSAGVIGQVGHEEILAPSKNNGEHARNLEEGHIAHSTESDGGDSIYDSSTRFRELMKIAEARDRTVLARQTFHALRYAKLNRAEQRMLEAADGIYQQSLKRKVLKQMVAVHDEQRRLEATSDFMYNRKVAATVLQRGLDEVRARRVAVIDRDRVRGLYLYKLTLAARESALQRRKEARLKFVFWQKLYRAFHDIRIRQSELENILIRHETSQRHALMHAALATFAGKTDEIQSTRMQADTRYQSGIVRAAIEVWRARLHGQNDAVLTAADAREYFLMKRLIRCLRAKAERHKKRREVLARWTLDRWRTLLRSKKHVRYDEAYRIMRRTIKMNLARRALGLLRQRTTDFCEADIRADQYYHNTLLRRIAHPLIIDMSDTCVRNTENRELAARYLDQRLKRLAVQTLGTTYRRIESTNSDADRFRQIKLEQRAQACLRELRMDAWRVRRDQVDADAIWARKGRRTAREALAKLRVRALGRQRGIAVLSDQQDSGIGNSSHMQMSAINAVAPAAAVNSFLPVMTPARKRDQLMVESSTRFSTTPAYTPFLSRLRAGPHVLSMGTDPDGTDDDYDDIMDESALDISA